VRHAPPTRVLSLALLVGLLLAGGPASAGPPTDRLRELFTAVNGVLADSSAEPLDKVARIKSLVTDIADVRGAAAAALDHEWQARSVAEREEFTRLFAELLERGFVARLAATVSPVNGMTMTYRGETRAGDEARVTTEVESRDGRLMLVEYRMAQRRGRWLVYDVVVDGISTVDNYRAQFKRLLRQGSYADLVATLRAKLGEETLMFAQAAPPAPRAAARTEEAPPRPAAALPRAAARPAATAKTPAPGARTPQSIAAAPVTKAPATRTPVWIAAAPEPALVTRPAPAAGPAPAGKPAALARRPAVKTPIVATVTRPLPPPADVLSPLQTLDVSGLPSALLVTLGFLGVSGAVYLRRRASV
jgi:phospholipid transport system substrate-binding protein